MTEGVQGVFILVALSLCVSVTVHYFFRSYFPACFASALLASGLFQIFSFLHLGHLDPFSVIAFFVGAVIVFFISLVVGLPFLKFRREINL